MPKIPNRKTNSVARMMTSFQVRFLFMTFFAKKANYTDLKLCRELLNLCCFFLRGGDLRDGGLSYFHDNVIGWNAQMNRIVFKRHDRSPQAAAGGHLIAGL